MKEGFQGVLQARSGSELASEILPSFVRDNPLIRPISDRYGLATGLNDFEQAGLNVAGGFGGAVGDVVGGVLETADDLTGEIVSGA